MVYSILARTATHSTLESGETSQKQKLNHLTNTEKNTSTNSIMRKQKYLSQKPSENKRNVPYTNKLVQNNDQRPNEENEDKFVR